MKNSIDNANPDGEIRIEFTGLRPGEKLYEELLIGDDLVQSEHPRIMQAKENKLPLEEVIKCIEIINLLEKNKMKYLLKSSCWNMLMGTPQKPYNLA